MFVMEGRDRLHYVCDGGGETGYTMSVMEGRDRLHYVCDGGERQVTLCL